MVTILTVSSLYAETTPSGPHVPDDAWKRFVPGGVRPAKVEKVFSNLYSRPNDDTFQNATGNAGEPYEVARINCALVAEKTDKGFNLAFDWHAVMTTGRHVEAGNSFMMTEAESNLKDRPETRDKPFGIKYAKGSGPDSLPQQKKGSILFSRMDIGKTEGDGTYSGKLVIRRGEKLGVGLNQFRDNGPKTGVFQFISWKIEVKNGEIVNPDIECKRGKEPHLKKMASSYQKIDPTKPQHKPYPPQPKGAVCKEETVGEGEDSTEERVHTVKLAKAVGKAIKLSGCLDCHGEGNGDSQLFCDDGTAVNPGTTYRSVHGFLDPKFDWKATNPDGKVRYPKGMSHCCSTLRDNLEAEGLKKLKELVESAK